jgi:hypothetical protein
VTVDDVARLVAYEQIRQLAARYALATDSRDLDLLVSLFVDDVQVGRDGRGREALRAAFDASLRQVGVTVLNVGTHVIDLDDDDHARGVVYCRGEIQVGDQWVIQAIQYRDTYHRRDGRWYFVRRRHLLWYGADVLQRPLGLPHANWPEHHTGKGELPEAWPTWAAFWDRGPVPADDQ